jgi:hypothetical protein
MPAAAFDAPNGGIHPLLLGGGAENVDIASCGSKPSSLCNNLYKVDEFYRASLWTCVVVRCSLLNNLRTNQVRTGGNRFCHHTI